MPGERSEAEHPEKEKVTGHQAIAGMLPATERTAQEAAAASTRESPAQRRARFTALAEPIYDAVYRAAVRVCRDRDLANDLSQDAFVRAFEKFHQFRQGTNFKAWVLRIMVNGYINRYRRQKRQPGQVTWDEVTAGEERDLAARADELGSPEDTVVAGLSARLVRRAVDALPEPFRTAVILADLQGLSYKEVRQVLGVPLGTVRSRIFRGRKLLMEALEPHRAAGAL